MLANVGLDEDDRLRRVQSRRKQDIGQTEDIGPQCLAGGWLGQRVKIDDAEDVVVVSLLTDPVANRPEVVAEMEIAGRLDPGEDFLASRGAVRTISVNATSPVARAVTTIPPGSFTLDLRSRGL